MNLTKRPLLIAHRGESNLAPENSIAAGRLAIEHGATALEIDVRICGSGELIVFHDNFLQRHFGIFKSISLTSWNELKQLQFKKHYSHPDRVCSLTEFLEAFKGTVPINLDVKILFQNYRKFAQSLISTVDEFKVIDQVWVSSFNPYFLKVLKNLRGDIRIGYLFRVLPSLHKVIELMLTTDAWHPHHSLISDSFIKVARELKKEIYVWTINEAAVMQALMPYNFDGIITDTLYKT